jgi:hypothetical protein
MCSCHSSRSCRQENQRAAAEDQRAVYRRDTGDEEDQSGVEEQPEFEPRWRPALPILARRQRGQQTEHRLRDRPERDQMHPQPRQAGKPGRQPEAG